MQIVMMGTGPFAVPTFQSLLDSEHEVLALVTRPTPPVRSRKSAPPNPAREVAQQAGLPIIDPEDVNTESARERIRQIVPQLFVVCDYGQILAADTLAIAPSGGVNLHGSLLPKYRGAAPVNWAILRGEQETGITVIHMTPRLDAGPALARRTTRINPQESAAQLEPRLAELGVDAVHEAIRLLEHWDGSSSLGEPQDQKLATRARRLRKSDGLVDWSRSARQIYDQVRGLKPWPGTFTHLVREHRSPLRLILDHVSVADEQQQESPPGSVVSSAADALRVATGRGTLAIHRVQPSGKRIMSADEFLRGHALTAGDRFTSQPT
jgi:methionyl-tRNA formyltransferase